MPRHIDHERPNKVAYRLKRALEIANTQNKSPIKPHPNDHRPSQGTDRMWIDLTMRRLRTEIIERMIETGVTISIVSYASWLHRHTVSRFLHRGTPDINTMRALSFWLKDPDFWRPYKVNETITKKYLQDEFAVPYTGDGVTTSSDSIGKKYPKESPSNDHRTNTRSTQKTRRKSPQ